MDWIVFKLWTPTLDWTESVKMDIWYNQHAADLEFASGVELFEFGLGALHVALVSRVSLHPRMLQRLRCRQPLCRVQNQKLRDQVLTIYFIYIHVLLYESNT